MAEIVADGITKRYPDGSVAVACLDLAIADGEFVILVGPSGCGKSTTLNMFAGLEDISDGELRIDGVRVNETAPRDRDIAMVFQNYALYPHMTVRQNIEFPLTLARPRPGKDEIAAKVAEVSSILGLDDYLDRKPAQLSGGQRQRVAMGRAIVRSPKAFLMDEPLSNLDAKLRGAMRVEIARLQARLGTTTVYVTHDQTEAMTLGDRVVVMRDGQVQQIGTPDDLYNNPVNLFVAGFIGSPAMNMLTGRLTAQGVQTDFGLLALPDVSYVEQAAALVHGDGEVVVGIRPEHLHDAALAAVAGVPPGTQEIVAIVDVLESLGSDNYAHLQIPGGEIVARLSPQSQIRRGNRATLSFEPGSIAVFDAKSGINLSR
ncbi:sn-glycerol-3-phosphate ABC transporter ATP-binding protein UgpC [Gordonia defluvii]|jgi:multiple sugar transport system ATP-binding protein|uniref:Sn-glycerol-3-phosphate ABC transporter ATP-binding protein UgpC n=1 Tax=Gordonia defluvii TaxID=283718 RepID=A0ABP6LKT0_9ACTN|nr:sn-glycerol-3-phosphate ABC transporter ATP-binding protein UgpC [Gordonia sp. UBA5067]